MKRTWAALSVVAALLAPAGPAAAVEQATVSRGGETITYLGTSGVDDLVVADSAGVVRFTQASGVVAGASCVQVSETVVECPPAVVLQITLGAGNDKVDASAVLASTFIYPEAGNDTVIGSPAYDTVTSIDSEVDTIDCGLWDDLAYVDTIDVVTNCDHVNYPPPSPPGPPPSYLTVTSPIVKSWTLVGAETKVAKLKVTKVPTGGTVVVKCSRGKSCPFKSKTAKISATNTAKLTAFFKKRKLKAGVVIEVRITAPTMIGKVVRFTVRKNKVPSVKNLCLPPWASKPTAC